MTNGYQAYVDYHLKQIEANLESTWKLTIEYHMDQIEGNLKREQAKLLESAQAHFVESIQGQVSDLNSRVNGVLAEVTSSLAADKQSIQETVSNELSCVSALRRVVEEVQLSQAKSAAGQTDIRSQVTALRINMEEQAKSAVGQMTKMGTELSQLRRDVEDLPSKQPEGQLSQVSMEVHAQQVASLQKDMQAHAKSAAEQNWQLLSLKREVEDLQSPSAEGCLPQLTDLQTASQKDFEVRLSELRRDMGAAQQAIVELGSLDKSSGGPASASSQVYSKSTAEEMSKLSSQLLDLRRDVEELQSKPVEGRLPQVTALQKYLEVHSQNAAGQMKNLAAQLMELVTKVEDLQSNHIEEKLSQVVAMEKELEVHSRNTASLAAQMLTLEREVEDLQTKQSERSLSLMTWAAEEVIASLNKSDANGYSEKLTMAQPAAGAQEPSCQRINPPAEAMVGFQSKLRSILTPIPEDVDCQSDGAEATAGLQSRLTKTSSGVLPALPLTKPPSDEELPNLHELQEDPRWKLPGDASLEERSGEHGSEPHPPAHVPSTHVGPDASMQSFTQAGAQLLGLQRLENLGYVSSHSLRSSLSTEAKDQRLLYQAPLNNEMVGLVGA